MNTLTLDVTTRDLNRKAKDLLRARLIPIEYYGGGVDNKSLQADYQTFRKLFRDAGGNTVVEVTVDGKEKMNVLVHDVMRDPVTDEIMHVDLINVRMDQEIHTKIPLEFVGVSQAVKDLGGTLTHHLTEIEVKCLPGDLIHSVEVSVEPIMDFNTFIRVKDLALPGKITVLNDPEAVVIAAVPPRVEEEPEPVAAEGEEGAEAAEAAEGEAKEGEEAAGGQDETKAGKSEE